MATTSYPIGILAVGIRDTSGNALASGYARFYSPGTLTQQTVYSDSACSTSLSQPVTLNSAGQYRYVYTLETVRMIVTDSTDSTTHYDGDVNAIRHDTVRITHTGVNGGTETTLEGYLDEATTSLGNASKYLPTSTATTAMNYKQWLTDLVISVVPFGTAGNGTTDDRAAIQAAIDYCESLGGGWVYLPENTYRIDSALSIDTAGVKLRGAGRAVSIIKNYGTTTNSLTVNLGSAVDSKIRIEDLGFTCDTTTSGAAISVTNGDKIVIQGCSSALHRTGFDVNAVSGGVVRDCVIESGDANTAQIGINLGARGRAHDCELTFGEDNGTGIKCTGADGRVDDCYVNNSATAYNLAGARSESRGCHANGCTTGYSLSATDALASRCFATSVTTGFSLAAARTSCVDCIETSGTTGFSVGAFASCSVRFCVGTLLTVDPSATLFVELGNTITTTTNSGTSNLSAPLRFREQRTENASNTPTFTPDISGGKNVQVYGNSNGSTPTLTVAAHATATLTEGDVMLLSLYKYNATNMAITWNAQYTDNDGSAMSVASVTTPSNNLFLFKWNGTAWRCLFSATAAGAGGI